jgi:hypothetical protein
MSEQKKQPEMSLGCLGVMILVVWGLVYVVFTAGNRQKDNIDRPEAAAVGKPPEDPLLEAAFQAGIVFGAKVEQSGLTRPNETQLDGFAIQAADAMNTPPSRRGEVIKKFKRGYSWGLWIK